MRSASSRYSKTSSGHKSLRNCRRISFGKAPKGIAGRVWVKSVCYVDFEHSSALPMIKMRSVSARFEGCDGDILFLMLIAKFSQSLLSA